MREALLREHYRGGQSFLVAPRIADLPDLEEWLREEVPEVKAVTAHGQMSPTEVEERMSAFYDKKYDVLLSTTIVESGLDIPSANTLIVHRADRFGLAQLYQLRGRVGRSKTRAYAYLTTPPDRALTEGADKRLQVLANLDSLGAGFQLASHDLDIRGAGNFGGELPPKEAKVAEVPKGQEPDSGSKRRRRPSRRCSIVSPGTGTRSTPIPSSLRVSASSRDRFCMASARSGTWFAMLRRARVAATRRSSPRSRRSSRSPYGRETRSSPRAGTSPRGRSRSR